MENVDLNDYAPVLDLIAGELTCVKHLSQLLQRDEKDALIPFLLDLCRNSGTTLKLIRELLSLEFEQRAQEESGSILRGNSFCTALSSQYALGISRAYLKGLFAPLLTVVLRGEEGAEVDEMWYMQQAEGMFMQITRPATVARMPRELRAMVCLIGEMAQEHAPDSKYQLMAGFLFLRLYNPCFISPVHNGILPASSELSPQGRAHLMVLTKVLQHLSNNTKYSRYPMLSRWVSESQVRMVNFFDLVSQDSQDFNDLLFVMPSPVRLGQLDMYDINMFHTLLDRYRGQLRVIRDRCQAQQLSDIVRSYDELFRLLDALGPPVEEASLVRGSLDRSASSRPPSPRASPRSDVGPSVSKKVIGFLSKKDGKGRAQFLKAIERDVLPHLDMDDLSVTPSVTLLKIVRALMNEKYGVPPVFSASECCTWLLENLVLDHRGSGLILMRRLTEDALLVADEARDRASKIQDDETAYRFHGDRVKMWETFLGRHSVQEVGDFDMPLRSAKKKLLRYGLMRGAAPATAVDEAKRKLVLGQICSKMLDSALGLKLERERRVKYASLNAAQEWVRMHLNVSHVQAMDVMVACFQYELIRSKVGLELSRVEDDLVCTILRLVLRVLQYVSVMPARLYQRSALLQLLTDEEVTARSPREHPPLPFGHLHDDSADLQVVWPEDLEALRGRGSDVPLQRWDEVWQLMEKQGFLASQTAVLQEEDGFSLPCYYYATSAGMEFLTDRESCVPLRFVFDTAMIDAVIQLTCGECGKPISAGTMKVHVGDNAFHPDCQSGGNERPLPLSATLRSLSSSDLKGSRGDVKSPRKSPRWKKMTRHSPRGGSFSSGHTRRLSSANVTGDDDDDDDDGERSSNSGMRALVSVLTGRRKQPVVRARPNPPPLPPKCKSQPAEDAWKHQ